MSVSNEESMDLPLAIALPPRQSNGVPESRRFENTGEVETAVAAAINSEENTVEALAKLILVAQPSKGGGDGNGGDAGAKVLKDIKKHKWLAVLMTLIVGPGGMTATYYAIKDRGIANEAAVQKLTKDAIDARPRIDRNTNDIRLIKVDITKINENFTALKGQNTSIAKGVESLKQVNVDRLEKENDKLERKIRALERER